MTEANPIDFNMLQHLKEVLGNEMQWMLLEHFIAYAPQQYEQLNQAFENKDFDYLRYKSHQFRGECLQMGATLLGQVCKELEEKAQTMQIAHIESCLEKLHYETQRAIAVLKQAH
jgi:HPt (histidine-containing phosphotransfer) domain-containing protein